MDDFLLVCNTDINWEQLEAVYVAADFGHKPAEYLKTVFSNSMFKCFAFDGPSLIGAGRVLGDGLDCAYICDVVVLPQYQGRGVGRAVMRRLMELSAGHNKIILYANPGKEGFYRKLGFCPMNTAMAIFKDKQKALASGVISES